MAGARTVLGLCSLLLLAALAGPADRGQESKGVKPGSSDPLSPHDEIKSFKVAPGYRVELVAAEPLVHDPVALAFGGHQLDAVAGGDVGGQIGSANVRTQVTSR